jgi:hypothetical protein
MVTVPFVVLGLAGFAFFLEQAITMHNVGLIVASGVLLFAVAGLVFNLLILTRLRRRL